MICRANNAAYLFDDGSRHIAGDERRITITLVGTKDGESTTYRPLWCSGDHAKDRLGFM